MQINVTTIFVFCFPGRRLTSRNTAQIAFFCKIAGVKGEHHSRPHSSKNVAHTCSLRNDHHSCDPSHILERVHWNQRCLKRHLGFVMYDFNENEESGSGCGDYVREFPRVVGTVGTECTLVHCSLYTGCIYRVLTPRELKNQVVNLQNIATGTIP